MSLTSKPKLGTLLCNPKAGWMGRVVPCHPCCVFCHKGSIPILRLDHENDQVLHWKPSALSFVYGPCGECDREGATISDYLCSECRKMLVRP